MKKITFNPTTNINNIIHTATTSIYPNPAYNNITISSSGAINSIVIANLLGQAVYKGQYNGCNKEQIDIANLPLGIYFIKVNDSFVQKVVKE